MAKSFMDRLRAKVGKKGSEPPPDENVQDTVPEPARTRRPQTTAIVCSRGRQGGCTAITLAAETPAEAHALMVAALPADDAEQTPWPERLAHGSRLREPPKEWPPEDLVETVARVPELTDADLPGFPFHLYEWLKVTGPAWLVSIKQEVAKGAKGTRARLGGLQLDLRALKRILTGGGPCLSKMGSSICRHDAGHLVPHQDAEVSW